MRVGLVLNVGDSARASYTALHLPQAMEPHPALTMRLPLVTRPGVSRALCRRTASAEKVLGILVMKRKRGEIKDRADRQRDLTRVALGERGARGGEVLRNGRPGAGRPGAGSGDPQADRVGQRQALPVSEEQLHKQPASR